MKKILCLIVAGIVAVSAFAGTVRITLNGNKNFVVMIDGKTYTPNTTSNSMKEILINDLKNGQHTIEIFRPNNRGVNKELYSSSFDLSQNESIHITVNANGGVKIDETTSGDAYGSTNRTPMTDAVYSQLFKTINVKRGQAAKLTAAKEAFNTTTNYFSTYQASEIIRLINAEHSRLLLAKLAYDNLTDPAVYTELHDLFDRQASIDELDIYVRSNTGNKDPIVNNSRTAMSDANFNTLYETIRKKWLPGSKMMAASDVFNNETNYFTTAQAKKIIALVSDERNRLDLAKLSFDNITDQANFRQLYDLLNTQASRDELDAYIRSNYNYAY